MKSTEGSMFLTNNVKLPGAKLQVFIALSFARQRDYKLNSSTQCSYFKGIFLFSGPGRNVETFQLQIHSKKVFSSLHALQAYSFQTVPSS